MRTVQKLAACGLVFAAVLFGLRERTSAREGDVAASGFGGTVLVGDGEVFVGEAANQFRPGMVYVYQKAGAGWQQAATLLKPGGALLSVQPPSTKPLPPSGKFPRRISHPLCVGRRCPCQRQ